MNDEAASAASPVKNSAYRLVRAASAYLAVGAAWLVATAMAWFAIAWLAGYAPAPVYRWVNAFTGYVYLPAFPLLAAAVITRQRRLSFCLAAIAVWHAAVVLPSILPLGAATQRADARQSIAHGSHEQLKVFYANVGNVDGHIESLFEEIRRADPDVIVLTEFTSHWHDKFNETEFPAEYPHHVHLLDYNPAATGVYSRLPVSGDQRVYQQKRVMVSAKIELAGTTLRLYAVHGPRPIRSPLHRYEKYWELVNEHLSRETSPMLVVGDFNATPYSLIYRKFVSDHGFRDVHVACGRGAATTWPNATSWLPPIRIDHAFVSPDVGCLEISEGGGAGSDHKPLSIGLAVPIHGLNRDTLVSGSAGAL